VNVDDMSIEELRLRLIEAEGNLQAIYSGEIDALLLADEKGQRRVFTLRSADAPYRALVERMQEGAATLSVGGDIVYCNQRFADLVRVPLEQVMGTPIGRYLPAAEGEIVRAMLDHGSGRYQTRLVLDGQEATEVQVTFSSIVLDDVEHRTLILSDISSLARAQRENRSKDEFLAMLAPRDAGARAQKSARRDPGRGPRVDVDESRTDGTARDEHHQAPGDAHGATRR
jgi:PAS domain-containing protein